MRIRRTRRRLVTGFACLALLTAAGWALHPQPASAHAELVSAQPAPWSTLALAPSVAVLRYSEPLDARFSVASIVSPTGRRYRSSVSSLSLRVPLPTNAPGIY